MRALFGMCYTREQPGWQDTVIQLVDVFLDGLRLRRPRRRPAVAVHSAASRPCSAASISATVSATP